MQFSTIKLAVAALAVCSDAVLGAVIERAITPAQMVTNIQLLTSKSQALQAPAQSISIINGPLIVVGLGPFPVCEISPHPYIFYLWCSPVLYCVSGTAADNVPFK